MDPGKDGDPHLKPLTPDGVKAFRLFIHTGGYCFSYTTMVLTVCPSAFVPVVVTVCVLPSRASA